MRTQFNAEATKCLYGNDERAQVADMLQECARTNVHFRKARWSVGCPQLALRGRMAMSVFHPYRTLQPSRSRTPPQCL